MSQGKEECLQQDTTSTRGKDWCLFTIKVVNHCAWKDISEKNK